MITDNKYMDLEEISAAIADKIEDTVQTAVENAIADTVQDAVENAIGDAADDIMEDAIFNAVQESLCEALSDMEFVLKNGTVARPRSRMKVMAPDKSKLVYCYGGLRVDGSTLMVQTRISCWDSIAYYADREEAIAALLRVKEAMESGTEIFEL